MVDGTYAVEGRTPLGKKKGTLVLATDGGTCTADLDMAGRSKRFEGAVDGDHVSFSGSLKLPFPLGLVNYELECDVVGDELTGTCRSKKFSFAVKGTRTA